MISQDKVTEIYFLIDEFFKNFDSVLTANSLPKDKHIKSIDRKFKLSDSEVMTILVLFHYGSFKNIKHFYLHYIQKHMTQEFPTTCLLYTSDAADE